MRSVTVCSSVRHSGPWPGSTTGPARRGVLAKATVLEIVHDQGRQLQALAHARAEAVLERNAAAAAVLLLVTMEADPDEEPAEPAGPSDSQQSAGPSDPAELTGPGDPAEPIAERPAGNHVGFASGPLTPPEVARDQPRQVDPGTLLVVFDEVKVHAQHTTGRKQLLVYTALGMTAGLSWHFAAATAAELAYQVGALLAVLEVHRGARSLLVLADGTRWVRGPGT